jgi:3-isopropylmalate/(R)-2-methylmalate dehydratase small subunit
VIKGKVIKFGDHINTDVIYPSRFLSIAEPLEMAKHAFEVYSEEFPKRIEKNSFIVAGHNFGCGSSREQAVTCLKFAGVAAVIAKGFSRIYYRNAINEGFRIIQCNKAVDNIQDGEIITVDFDAGEVITSREIFRFNPFPSFISEIINAGGLVEYTKNKIKARKHLA